MKRTNFLSAMLIAGLCAFSACDKDNDNDNTKEEVESKLNPEQHKAKIAEEGELIVAKMGTIADLKTYNVIDAFVDLMDGSETKSSSSVMFGLNEIISVKTGTKESVEAAEVYKISDEFKNQKGIFTWNVETKKWDKKESTTEITYKFKVDGEDAEVSVSSFKTVAASIDDDRIGNIEYELPLELKMHIKLGSTTLSSFELIGKWNDDNTPKSIVEKLIIEDFTFKGELTNNGETISVSTSFKHNDYTIYANEIKIDGDFDYETLLSTADLESEYSEVFAQELIEKGNVWIQLGNIKVKGVFDARNFIADLNPDKKPTDSELVDLLNKHSKLYVKYANENEIIAKGEFYLYSYVDYEKVYTEVDMKMVFCDDSAVSADFFKTGFSAVITDISNLIEKINKNYDLDIDTID